YTGYGYRATYVKGSVEIGKLTSISSPSTSIRFRHYYNQPDVTFNQVDILNPNRLGDAQFYHSPIAIFSDTTDTGDVSAAVHPNIDIKNVNILNNNPISTFDV